ncbi:MAG TPA: 30S ribosomal protein THX, partial [Saprospiraceae bacterium]|nr:30S ribosomal protein THX [Saprospiraceae bacterium]
MGKGDFRSKRGKIRRGSHGNSRPKLKKLKTLQKN